MGNSALRLPVVLVSSLAPAGGQPGRCSLAILCSTLVRAVTLAVMMLSRDRHAQLVVRHGPLPDFAALIAAGKVILIDGLVDEVSSASQLAPNSDAPTSEVSPAFAFVIDSVAQHLNDLPTDHDECHWLTVHGSAIPKFSSPSSERPCC